MHVKSLHLVGHKKADHFQTLGVFTCQKPMGDILETTSMFYTVYGLHLKVPEELFFSVTIFFIFESTLKGNFGFFSNLFSYIVVSKETG